MAGIESAPEYEEGHPSDDISRVEAFVFDAMLTAIEAGQHAISFVKHPINTIANVVYGNAASNAVKAYERNISGE